MLDKLNGFRLGQYKFTVTNELGNPDVNKTLDDSSLVDFYFLDSDSSTHLAFMYQNHSDEIYAIQVTGDSLAIPFYGLSLGDNSIDIFKNFPQPDTIIDVDFNDKVVQTWIYNSMNYSFVLVDNKLNSIKIWDDYSRPDYSSDDYELPDIVDYMDKIVKLDTNAICDLLSPNLEIFYCDKIISWKNSIDSDVYLKKSSVFEFITSPLFGVITLSKYDSIPADLNLRYVESYGVYPVYKIAHDDLIQEIVFNYQQGRYKIWEVKFRCHED